MSLDLVCRDDGHFLPGRRWLVEVEVGCSFFFLGGDSWSRLLRLRSQLLQEGERERDTHTHSCVRYQTLARQRPTDICSLD